MSGERVRPDRSHAPVRPADRFLVFGAPLLEEEEIAEERPRGFWSRLFGR